jgi:hypothetical protein
MAAREDTWQKVRGAVESLHLRCDPITVKTVAKIARVARATIYNDPELLHFVQNYEPEQQFNAGFEAGAASGETNLSRTDSAAKDDWARGILYIDPGEPITRDLLRRRRAQLSHFLHPDKGGDTALQQALNTAFDILKGKAA